MSRILLPLLLSLSFAMSGAAQDLGTLLADVREKAASSFVTVTYKAEVSGPDGNYSDSGVIEAQRDMWHIKGGYFDIYTVSDGTWIVDGNSKEIYIEPAWTYDDLLSFHKSFLSAGSAIEADVLSVSQDAMKPESHFKPSFTEEWVVTDLR